MAGLDHGGIRSPVARGRERNLLRRRRQDVGGGCPVCQWSRGDRGPTGTVSFRTRRWSGILLRCRTRWSALLADPAGGRPKRSGAHGGFGLAGSLEELVQEIRPIQRIALFRDEAGAADHVFLDHDVIRPAPRYPV